MEEHLDRKMIVVKAGDTKSWTLSFNDEEKKAKDITDWIIYFTVKKSIKDDDKDALITKKITEHSDPTKGKSQLNLAQVDTKDLNGGNYVFDIRIKTATSQVFTMMEGVFTVSIPVRRTLNNG